MTLSMYPPCVLMSFVRSKRRVITSLRSISTWSTTELNI